MGLFVFCEDFGISKLAAVPDTLLLLLDDCLVGWGGGLTYWAGPLVDIPVERGWL